SPDKSYHAYYPYQNDSDMNGKVSPGDKDFFKLLVKAWSVKDNQRTYAQYTASDLMTARHVPAHPSGACYEIYLYRKDRRPRDS
uniref:fimbrillin family protein n=1 Tax=Bacteroides intestinalis TaxID=329854 RepID=UPI0022DF9FB9